MPSGSMLPTLQQGDYFITSKSAYGYSNFSFPFGEHPPVFAMLKTAPARGDIILFRLPKDPATTYIKRVIGLAGDRGQTKHGIVYLNASALERQRLGAHHLPEGYSAEASAVEYRETLPGGKSYQVIELAEDSELDDTSEFIVPAGSCFVLGDNRDNSNDSRYKVGFVPYANVFAKALVVIDYSGKTFRTHAVE